MTLTAQIALLAWIPLVLYIFSRLPARTAVIVSFITAWLFLPERAEFAFSGLPEYNKLSATCYGAFLAILLFDSQRLRSFKFGWLDVPMLVWCLCPLASSLSNGLGAYDGLSEVLNQTMIYGIPYFIGRIYLNNLAGLRQLAIGIFVGGLIYVPLCLYEIRMSPQLHRIVYGYHAIEFGKNYRLGGFRPTVFMSHGLAIGMWMMAATLIGIWLLQAGAFKNIFGNWLRQAGLTKKPGKLPTSWLVIGLLVTFVLVKSTGAYVYFAYGIGVLFFAKWFRSALPLLLLIVVIFSYLGLGVTGNFSLEKAEPVISLASDLAGSERASSLAFRLDNEEILSAKARQRMIFGWGGWGRNRVYGEDWTGDLVDISTTDSLWIIAFGLRGVVGLAALFATSLLPALCFGMRYSARSWFNPKVAPAAVLSVVIVLYMVDCTLNDKPNPVFTLASGGIAGLVMREPERLKVSDRPLTRQAALQQHRRLVQGETSELGTGDRG